MIMKESTHEVTSRKGKLEWLDYPPDNNISVQQWECGGCGRARYKVHCEGECIKTFG
jgi:hypothetical protein